MRAGILSLDELGEVIAEKPQGVGNSHALRRAAETMKIILENELTARQAQCMRLYYFEGYRQTAIAQELGISKSVVCRHLKKGRERLMRAMRYSVRFRNEEY